MSESKECVRALLVGGCAASYHLLEPVVAPIGTVLEQAGFAVEVAGIRHPEGPDGPLSGDYSALTESGLRGISLVVLYTTGRGHGEDVGALRGFVERGGALVGIHCAADSFTDNPDWVAMLGGAFRTHPAPLEISVDLVRPEHPVLAGVDPFTVRDELYLFRDFDPSNVELLLETSSAQDPAQPGPIPVCWVREPGEGRVVYLSLGHFPEVMEHPSWQRLLANGVGWAVRRS